MKKENSDVIYEEQETENVKKGGKKKLYIIIGAAALALLIAVVAIVISAKYKVEKKPEKIIETSGFTASWSVSPSIEAESIEPLVRADFNEVTKHYDISYADCFKIKQNGKYGIIGFDGKIIIKPQYDEIFAIRNSQNFIGVKIDSDGDRHQTYIHYPTFETEEAHKKYNSEKYEYYWIAGRSKGILMKTSGDNSEKEEFNPIVPETVTGVKASEEGYNPDGTYGLYANSKNVMGMVYSGAGQFSDGKAAFKSGDKWGYIDSNGRTVHPFEYDAVPGYSALGGEDTPYESFNGYVTLYKNGKYGIAKADGTLAAPFVYDGATPVVNGKAFVNSSGKWGVVMVEADEAEAENETTAATEITTEKTEPITEKTTEKTTEETTEKTTEATDENEEETSKKSEYTSGTYTVNGDLNLRSSTSTDYDNVVGAVPDGESVYVDSVDGKWGHVEYDGHEGWIYLGLAEKE